MNTYNESVLINLNSANALKNNGEFLSNVYFQFKNIIDDNQDIINITASLNNAQIPYSFYNINVYNNILYVNYLSTDYTLTLTRGNYNASNLITEINTQLTNNGLNNILNITISSTTGLINITNVSANPFKIYSTSTLNKVLGLYNIDYIITTTITAPNPLNLLGTLRLRISSYELMFNNIDSSLGTTSNIIASIPIEAPTFGVILYDNLANIQYKLKNKQLDGFDISILDDDSNYINFNNVNWTMSFIFTFTKRYKEQDNKTLFDYLNRNLINIQQIDEQQDQPEEQQDQQPEEQQPEEQEDIPQTEDLGDLLYYNNIDPNTGLLIK